MHAFSSRASIPGRLHWIMVTKGVPQELKKDSSTLNNSVCIMDFIIQFMAKSYIL